MAIEEITGLYDSSIEKTPKKRSLAQKLCPYVLATGLFLNSPSIINAQEKSNQFDANKYLNNSFSEYIKKEKLPLGIMGASLAAGWLSLLLPKSDNIRNISAIVFAGSAALNLYRLNLYSK